MTLENQRYGRNKDTIVNKTYIESGEYRRKFDSISDNPDVNRTLYDCAKKALVHRSGTVLEDMYWVNEKGEVTFSVTNSTIPRQISYSKKIKANVEKRDNLVTLHTHPGSMPPSASDLNSCYSNGYQYGIVACHNGKVFKYSSKSLVNESLYEMYIGKGISKGLSEFDAQWAALKELSRSYDINVQEVI